MNSKLMQTSLWKLQNQLDVLDQVLEVLGDLDPEDNEDKQEYQTLAVENIEVSKDNIEHAMEMIQEYEAVKA